MAERFVFAQKLGDMVIFEVAENLLGLSSEFNFTCPESFIHLGNHDVGLFSEPGKKPALKCWKVAATLSLEVGAK